MTWLAPTPFCKECWLLQKWFAQQKTCLLQNGRVHWAKFLTKCFLLLQMPSEMEHGSGHFIVDMCTGILLHRLISTGRLYTYSSFTETPLHTEAFSLYTSKLLHIDAFTHRSFYTEDFTISFYTKNLLHKDDFAQNADKAFTQRSFYTEKLLHRTFSTERPLHGSLYTDQLLRADAFSHKSLHTVYVGAWSVATLEISNFTTDLAVGSPFRAQRLPLTYFTSVFAVWPWFRAKGRRRGPQNSSFATRLAVR